MGSKVKKIFSLIMAVGMPALLYAGDKVPMAGVMRSNGKIYVVVAVLVIIFIGILLFLLSLERKIRRLEKDLDK